MEEAEEIEKRVVAIEVMGSPQGQLWAGDMASAEYAANPPVAAPAAGIIVAVRRIVE
jgi:hypothetical protein